MLPTYLLVHDIPTPYISLSTLIRVGNTIPEILIDHVQNPLTIFLNTGSFMSYLWLRFQKYLSSVKFHFSTLAIIKEHENTIRKTLIN